MTRIDPQKFVQSADAFDAIVTQAQQYESAARGSLGGYGGIAGTDPGGEQFAQGYDAMAQAAMQCLFDIGVSARGFDRVLMASAGTHAQANANAEGAGADVTGSYPLRDAIGEMSVAPLPTFFGGSPDTEVNGLDDVGAWLWDQVINIIGSLWPDGDPEELEAAGRAWSEVLGDITSLRTAVLQGDSALAGIESGEVAQIDTQTSELAAGLLTFLDVEEGIGDIGGACSDYANTIREVREETKQMIIQLAIEIAVGAGISFALSFVTFGASAVVGGGVIAARVTALGARILTVIGRVLAAAQRIGPRLTRIATALRTAGTNFPRFTRAGIEIVSGTTSAVFAEGVVQQGGANFLASLGSGFVGSGVTSAIVAPFGARGQRFVVQALANGVGGVGGSATDLTIRGEEITPEALIVSAALGVGASARIPGRRGGANAASPTGAVDAPALSVRAPGRRTPTAATPTPRADGDPSMDGPSGTGDAATGANVSGSSTRTDYDGPAGQGGDVGGSSSDGAPAPDNHGEAPAEQEIVVTSTGDGDPSPAVSTSTDATGTDAAVGTADPTPGTGTADPVGIVDSTPGTGTTDPATGTGTADPAVGTGAGTGQAGTDAPATTAPGDAAPGDAAASSAADPATGSDSLDAPPATAPETAPVDGGADGAGTESSGTDVSNDAAGAAASDAAGSSAGAGDASPAVRADDGSTRSFADWRADQVRAAEAAGVEPRYEPHAKGEYGEAVGEQTMADAGWERVDAGARTPKDVSTTGIDGIYRQDLPDGTSRYAIIESKFGSSRLSNSNDGQQLSSSWLGAQNASEQTRVDRAFEGMPVSVRSDFDDRLARGEVERIVLRVDADGNVQARGVADRITASGDVRLDRVTVSRSEFDLGGDGGSPRGPEADGGTPRGPDGDDGGPTPRDGAPASHGGDAAGDGASPAERVRDDQPPRNSDELIRRRLDAAGFSPENGFTVEDVHDLRRTPSDQLTADQRELLRILRDSVPPLDAQASVTKVIPFDDIQNYLGGWDSAGGFMLHSADIDPAVPLQQVVDDLRLDYVPDEGSNPFTDALAAGDDRFGFLVFAPSQPDVITVPFDPNFATPGVQHGQPFSGNGFLLNQDNVFRPEFEVPQGVRMPLTSGAQLWQTIDGVPSLVAVFDAGAGFVRV